MNLNEIRIPASRHIFDIWRLGKVGGRIEYSPNLPLTVFVLTHKQYEEYCNLANLFKKLYKK